MIARLAKEIPSDKRIMITFGGGSVKKNGVYDQVKEALKNQAKNCCATEGTIADNQGFISSATNNQYNNNIMKMAIAIPTKTFLCFIIVFV